VPTFALMRPGVSLEQATAEVNTLMPASVKERWHVELTSAHAEQTRAVRRVLLIFQIAVLFVLFIACANVTNLLLARAAARQQELLVRIAIGASRADVARHTMLESTIIGLCGGAAGSAGAALSVALVRRLPPYLLPRLSEIRRRRRRARIRLRRGGRRRACRRRLERGAHVRTATRRSRRPAGDSVEARGRSSARRVCW
jgi:hypothetical protein